MPDMLYAAPGIATIKTVELDAVLGGRAVQHRELQGFKKPEEEEFETRLYVCKGKRVVIEASMIASRLEPSQFIVPFSCSSLNHDDVFVLDTKDKIFQFKGANSNILERSKALEVIQFLKDKYHEGMCDVAIVDDGKLQTESNSGEFWVIFGGFTPISKKVASEDDVISEKTPPKLYSITDGQVNPATQLEDRKAASQAAEEFISSQNRPKSTRVTQIIQSYETHSFKSNFDSWPSGSAPSTALLKQQGVGVKGMTKGAMVNEEVPPLLEGGGKIECQDSSAIKKDVGKFFSGDCYIVLYTYHFGDKKEDYYLCCCLERIALR
ncbi:villin 3 [Actinidia rufa]|uniref:Villin 3 n=1 Tax=Actinidia rufa TaxID=165716 RepID=A0A7J0GF50_9ERIC|nr:villin 3 [Actinidia rufa]